MIILMKGLNEAKSVEQVIGDFHDEDWVSKIIVIDGGSTDGTTDVLSIFPKVNTYVHPWIDWYHDMEIIQSNIALSYIKHGDVCFILDFDERMSGQLKQFLIDIDKNGMPDNADCVGVSRRSYELMRHEDSPFSIFDEEGWWLVSHQIGQYPDFQTRVIRRKLGMHWCNSPHHIMFGTNIGLFRSINIPNTDIIHYHGKEDARDRINIERKWAKAQRRRKELGLSYDIFEGSISREIVETI